ncbi:MAG: GatB/YqeY domain-containing protein [Planctomycetota bacterium]
MKERITKELKDAMKSRDKRRVSVLRMLLADIINVEKSGKDFKTIDVVRGYAKKLKKTIEEYERLQIQAEIDSCNEELKIVEEFLPKQMSDEELAKVVAELLESEKPGDIGSAMKIVMGKYKDVADGRKVQALVKEMFSKDSA